MLARVDEPEFARCYRRFFKHYKDLSTAVATTTEEAEADVCAGHRPVAPLEVLTVIINRRAVWMDSGQGNGQRARPWRHSQA